MHIRKALDSDLNDILSIERAAFGEETEAELVKNLLNDPSAQPLLSLLAFQDDRPVGHILFSKAHLTNSQSPVSIALLAPLAVIPDAQKQGIGGKLVERGLELLSQSGVDLVFLAGYPEYYTRQGFQSASPLGFEPTYPMPEEYPDAWMVRALHPDTIGSVSGKVVCADALNKPEYWRE
ncbi:N-acetyltransferase [Oscillatoriales cyanobacterium LEGE 11467]|uniref:N-acetyltransferase n=1 Tax=Zarconia navalis LEGE 11467 TaxID=1828826 RepID=A0A928VXJ8_9CYAN|nr:N-acetyltransferase [Zarconia navalis]MBE9042057.1 N-acetyltransferase [Zarconia navalis LEGE 11467]